MYLTVALQKRNSHEHVTLNFCKCTFYVKLAIKDFILHKSFCCKMAFLKKVIMEGISQVIAMHLAIFHIHQRYTMSAKGKDLQTMFSRKVDMISFATLR